MQANDECERQRPESIKLKRLEITKKETIDSVTAVIINEFKENNERLEKAVEEGKKAKRPIILVVIEVTPHLAFLASLPLDGRGVMARHGFAEREHFRRCQWSMFSTVGVEKYLITF